MQKKLAEEVALIQITALAKKKKRYRSSEKLFKIRIL
jgi:hypothetical protein